MHIKIGSRKSHLAQEQAFMVKERLEEIGHTVELFLKPSLGDLNLDIDLSKTDQKGVFTQDFNELLENKEVDCVVHSWKDLPIENSEKRVLTATLKREDSRDVFFIKKQSMKKKNWKILTSSPRREYHLSKYFDFLSDSQIQLDFKSIRGNIPTRFNKFLKDTEADGFCVAIAAIKRLINNKDFNNEHPELWQNILKDCEWSILPESQCPSAAAQGALALEVLKENKELITALDEINYTKTQKEILKEREILKAYGGGCHLSIGVTCCDYEQGRLIFKSGTHNNEEFNEIDFTPHENYPEPIDHERVWYSSREVNPSREESSFSDDKINTDKKTSVLVTRYEAFSSDINYDQLFVSGVKTWKKLFSDGVWVNGCLDSLGEEFYEPDLFKQGIERHLWLTREGLNGPKGFTTVGTYSLDVTLDPNSYQNKDYFVWSSGQLFLNELKKSSLLKEKTHFLGLGRSYTLIKKDIEKLGLKEGCHFFPFYDLKQLNKSILNSRG